MSRNPALKILFLYNSIFVFAGNLLGPLFAVYIQGFDNSVLTISTTWSVFLISTTLFTYVFSKFGDKFKEQEYCLMFGFLVRAGVWFLYIFVNNFFFVIVLQILLALGESFGSPAFDAILSQHLDKGHQMSEYSYWKIVSNLSIALATIVGGLVVSHFGFSYLFLCMSLLALFSFFGILTTPRKLL